MKKDSTHPNVNNEIIEENENTEVIKTSINRETFKENKNIEDIKASSIKKTEASQSWFQRISTFEKLFWLTIILLLIVYLFLKFLGHKNNLSDNEFKSQPIVGKYVEKLLPTNLINENISKNESLINEKLNLSIQKMNETIEVSVNDLFNEIEKNVDKYLDFHYSIKGSYIELFAQASGELSNDIQEKIFNEAFFKKVKEIDNHLENEFSIMIKNHIDQINTIALEGVDKELNNDALKYLNDSIQKKFYLQEGKTAVLVGARLGPTVLKALVAKISTRVTSTIMAKVSMKLATKLTTSGSATAASTICGPAVAICAPVAAIGTWVATDLAFISGDEHLNRAEFKNEILNSINENKSIISSEYKKNYSKRITSLSENIKKEYKKLEVLERKKVKEMFN